MANTYLTRTPSSNGNQKKFTISAWIKITTLGTQRTILCGYYGNSNRYTQLWQGTDDKIIFFSGIYSTSSTTTSANLKTTRVFRDTSAWYHIVLAVDTTLSTAGDRVKLYVNGELETWDTSYGSHALPGQNADFFINVTTTPTHIGTYDASSTYFEGCMSHFHLIDGTQYAASTFGSTDSTTGEWQINTSPSVTYGTNGFFILKDGNSVTDQSGNSNNLTVGGGTLTNTEDNPSDVFNTINVLNIQITGLTISNGNLTRSSNTGDAWRTTYGTLAASSGKFYWEQKVTGSVGSAHYIGITDQDENRQTNTNDFENANVSAYCYRGDGGKVTSVSGSTVLTASAGDSFTANDIIGVAMDLDNQKIYFSKNGTWQASGDPTSGSTGTGSFFNITAGKLYTPATACYNSGAGYHYNFGNGYFGTTAISSEGTNASGIGKFEYDVPAGYTALSTKGLNE